MPNSGSKLVLGSANFGLRYGISNNGGKLEKTELINILNLAEASGIKTIDTAQAYGDSEQRLGSLLRSKFDVITKIGVNLVSSHANNQMTSLVVESLDRLAVDRLSAVLLHRPELLLGPDGPVIASELNNLKEKGLTDKIGISIYSSEILAKINKLIELDIVQVPFNLFDQRILKSGWSEKLKEKGTEIHTRSTFLQGLLLMKRSEIPKYFSKNWPTLFEEWFYFQRKTGAPADEITLDFALKQSWIDKIVVGVDNALQLDRLLQIEVSKRCKSSPYFDVDDIDLLDPSRWRI
jgi:aryl-alcohol dehydrogenase-like predicted oxidoreductase